MYEFHRNKPQYFNFQYQTARDFIIPFIEQEMPVKEGMRVLEIGCAEAGVLKAFLERGCECVGVDLSASRIELAKEFLAADFEAVRIRFFTKDIYHTDPEEDFGYRFDIIVLKDVIEHIHDQDRFMRRMEDFLAPGGKVFFGFPPWQMPYGGHQQICDTKLLAVLPYFHLLPAQAYRFVLELFEKNPVKVTNLMEIHETGISIERFERIVASTGYRLLQRRYYLVNPIYQYKFGLKPIQQASLLARIPYVRNFLTTCMYYLVERSASDGGSS
ncbi:MAG: class I SAM-dependent methyltransferase [Saprospirales bacterium]|nr:class I SAM-dependent methyltransferase [Saprospirales bacterium]